MEDVQASGYTQNSDIGNLAPTHHTTVPEYIVYRRILGNVGRTKRYGKTYNVSHEGCNRVEDTMNIDI